MTDAGVFIDDGVADNAVFADADIGDVALGVEDFGVFGFEGVCAHNDDVVKEGAWLDDGADADDGAGDFGFVDNAAVGDEGAVHLTTANAGGGEVAGVGVDEFARLVEIELWVWVGEGEVGLEEGLDGADVFPIAVENEGVEGGFAEEVWDDFFAEVGALGGEGLVEGAVVEEVDAHVGEDVALAWDGAFHAGDGGVWHDEFFDDFGVFGFFDEFGDLEVVCNTHDTEARDFGVGHGLGGDSDGGARAAVLLDELLEVHPIELVAREDEVEVVFLGVEVLEVLADGVGSALIPLLAHFRLLGGEDIHAATAKGVEFVTVLDVAVEGGGIELSEDEDAVEPRVYAIADGDINEAVFASEGYGWLATGLGEGVKAGAATATHDNANDVGGTHVEKKL